MPEILAGALVAAGDRPAAVWSEVVGNEVAVGSTTYVTGAPSEPVVEVTFTAPTSGRVLLVCSGQMRDVNATGTRLEVAPEVYLGSDATGVLVVSASSEHRGPSGIVNWRQWHAWCRATIVTGLTPGATHYARLMHRLATAGGAGWSLQTRMLGVVPA